ncbi:MAG: glycine cleavage system H protein [Flavobacteriales bacterium]
MIILFKLNFAKTLKALILTKKYKKMNIPAELKYTKEHEWIKVDGDVVTIGVTEYAQSELGDIVYVEIETEGETLDQEEVFGTVEAVKTVSDLFMPISGEVLEVNTSLEANPEIVNSDPYGEGWMVKIRITDSSELDTLLSSEQYQELIA